MVDFVFDTEKIQNPKPFVISSEKAVTFVDCNCLSIRPSVESGPIWVKKTFGFYCCLVELH